MLKFYQICIAILLLCFISSCAKRYSTEAPFIEREYARPIITEIYSPPPSPAVAAVCPPIAAKAPKEELAQAARRETIPGLITKRASGPLIVIDPGHGGKDLGTHSKRPSYQEKHLTLTTSMMLKNYLQQMGYRTVLTRTDDIFIELDERANYANSLKPKLFISVHYNSAPSIDAEGIEIFYYKSEDNKQRSTDSKLLANAVLQQILENTEAKSRGVKHGNLSVIRQTNMPAILIEGGFLTNENERSKLKDPAYLKKIAWGMAKGIDNFVKGEGKKRKVVSSQ